MRRHGDGGDSVTVRRKAYGESLDDGRKAETELNRRKIKKTKGGEWVHRL